MPTPQELMAQAAKYGDLSGRMTVGMPGNDFAAGFAIAASILTLAAQVARIAEQGDVTVVVNNKG